MSYAANDSLSIHIDGGSWEVEAGGKMNCEKSRG